jgi:hypothetical protein
MVIWQIGHARYDMKVDMRVFRVLGKLHDVGLLAACNLLQNNRNPPD